MTISYTILTDYKGPIICVADNAVEAEKIKGELNFLFSGLKKNIVYLSDYEVSFQESLSPADTIVSQRLMTLNQLLTQQVDILIVTAATLATKLPPVSFIKQHVFQFKTHQKISVNDLINSLTQSDYQRVTNVSSHHEFSQRGSIIDFFPAHSKYPIRLELDDDVIDSMQYFDIHTQRSIHEELPSIDITPHYEYIPNKTVDTGWHRYLHNYHKKLDTLLDYFPNPILSKEPLKGILEEKSQYIPYPLSSTDLDKILKKNKVITKQDLTTSHIELSLDKKNIKQELNDLLKQKNLIFVCQSHFRLNQLEALLLSNDIPFKHVNHFYEFSSKKIKIGLCLGNLPHIIHLDHCYIIPEQNVTDKVILKESKATPSISTESLRIGDLMIHSDHGIGRFIGIETHTINQFPQDFVVIEYANEDRLMFPPDQLNKVHPYQGEIQQVDELKSIRFAKRKQKAIANIELFASKLLKLQSERETASISPIPLPNEYSDFIKDFPFSETPDQLSIMEHIINDYQSGTLFNRLVCGDVGFGKTEIAMRSAFIAIMNGYQVSLITPTTILATQHYNNFKDRFKKWNISMSLLSRSNKSDKTREKIANGDIQLTIGTHKLLSQSFSNLALVIIDEEHRFGVKQKDSVHAFNQAHKLSLTATPIPRSLNMALSKLRQISIMSHPPKSRLPIQTMVEVENDDIVKQALEREIHRGGQAYIIYNDVKNMHIFHKRISKLCPHFAFGIVHGQMPTSAIEKQMARFHSQGFQVLIASTIIESGLDIPNANTIIVYRADKLGLAQLHQIRGRVGRSHHQAYAYLLTPEEITQKATLRLNAVAKAMRLGSGFQLSVADLEIRGAGNLLGEEQSGHVNAIGLSYYTHLLNQATNTETHFETEVDIEILKIIPESYIPDTESRYKVYHKLANCHHDKTLLDITDELTDRYGKIPQETENLLKITQLKLLASKLKILSIKSISDSIIIDLGENTPIDTSHVFSLIEKHNNYSLGGPTHIKLTTQKPLADTQILLNRLAQSKT